jgi:hypothetical protein
MGTDLTLSISVWYGEGSGGRFKTSAEMAAALGTRDGMLTKPAQALDGLGIPATREDQLGGLIHVHGINSAGDELTVAAGSFDVARARFVAALAVAEVVNVLQAKGVRNDDRLTCGKEVGVAVHTKKDAARLDNRVLREAGVE